MSGDALTDIDLDALVAATTDGGIATLAVKQVPNTASSAS